MARKGQRKRGSRGARASAGRSVAPGPGAQPPGPGERWAQLQREVRSDAAVIAKVDGRLPSMLVPANVAPMLLGSSEIAIFACVERDRRAHEDELLLLAYEAEKAGNPTRMRYYFDWSRRT